MRRSSSRPEPRRHVTPVLPTAALAEATTSCLHREVGVDAGVRIRGVPAATGKSDHAGSGVGLEMDAQRLALLAHIFAVLAFVSGYVGTNVMTEVARRADTLDGRRMALATAGHFDRWLNGRGGTAVILTGPITLLAFGYSVTAPWIVVSTALFLIVPVLGGAYWAPRARRIDAAIAAGDDEAAARLLRARRNVAISRLENTALALVVVLMVVRPG